MRVHKRDFMRRMWHINVITVLFRVGGSCSNFFLCSQSWRLVLTGIVTRRMQHQGDWNYGLGLPPKFSGCHTHVKKHTACCGATNRASRVLLPCRRSTAGLCYPARVHPFVFINLKRKIKIFQCLNKHYDMKTSGELEVRGQAFLTLKSDEDEWLVLSLSCFTPPVTSPYQLDRKLRGFQSRSGLCGEEKYIVFLSRIKPRFLGRASRSRQTETVPFKKKSHKLTAVATSNVKAELRLLCVCGTCSGWRNCFYNWDRLNSLWCRGWGRGKSWAPKI